MDFVVASFRPMQIEREVDYGFPVNHPKIKQQDHFDIVNDCYYAGQCIKEDLCGAVCQRFFEPAGPLAESLVLANIIRAEKPDLVIALHNSAIGGSYDFMSWKPGRRFIKNLDQIGDLTGQVRHLAERIDIAKPHLKTRPDILIEPILEDDLCELEAYHGELQLGETFSGNVSMAQFVESELPNTRVFMPEAIHFSSKAFADLTPSKIKRTVSVQGKQATGKMTLPNGEKLTVDYGVKLAKKLKAGTHRITITQGMLGVEMVAMRNWLNDEMDQAWRNLPLEVQEFDHPIAAELRGGTAKPGYDRHTKDDEYKTENIPATKADEAMFFCRFNLILANRVGLIQRLIAISGADVPKISSHLQDIIDQLLKDFPPELQKAYGRGPGIKSQVLRTLLAMSDF
jgi:hypothetical protein